MYYAIYDIRPQHSEEPYLFHYCVGNLSFQSYAIYFDKEYADDMAQKMNSGKYPAPYTVKQISFDEYCNFAQKRKVW